MGNVAQGFRDYFCRPKNTNIRISLPAVCFVWQTAMIILFGVFIRYDEESDTHWVEHRREANITSDLENDFYFRYPSKFQPLLYYFCSVVSIVSINRVINKFRFFSLHARTPTSSRARGCQFESDAGLFVYTDIMTRGLNILLCSENVVTSSIG